MGGKQLFDRHRDLVAAAESVLGYSVSDICLDDSEQRLRRTEYAQPVMYVVNALMHAQALDESEAPAYYAGHSLGEFNALQAAGCFDFLTGLRLVAERGRIMGLSAGGGMAAVIGLDGAETADLLTQAGLDDVLEIANINAERQIVVSGAQAGIRRLGELARQRKGFRVVPLAVGAAFHSREMTAAAGMFVDTLGSTPIRSPNVPVVSNTTGSLFSPDTLVETLGRQMRERVRWWDGLMTLRGLGVTTARQIGPGTFLLSIWAEAMQRAGVAPPPVVRGDAGRPGRRAIGAPFCARHRVRYPYVAGSMYRGIASTRSVTRMAEAGLLSFFGAGGLPVGDVEKAIDTIRASVGAGAAFGVNLLASPGRPDREQAVVDLCLRRGIGFVEASGFTQVTRAIVEFRFKGARVDAGRAHAPNRLFAKISRVELATAFLSPPSEELLRTLLDDGVLSTAEAAAARRLPVCSDICVESDSGGHTDGGVALALLPTIARLRDRLANDLDLQDRPFVGAAGGLGTPEAVAAAFVLGADFVLTGSINQCTPEAGTSEAVKNLLCELDQHDTTYAPAGDMFELGAKAQVVRRRTLFPARANQLYQFYRTYDSLDQIPARATASVERLLGCSISDAQGGCGGTPHTADGAPAPAGPKAQMAHVFKTYFARSIESALVGKVDDLVNFQVHCGPAMGAFNGFVRGTKLENWQERHVDVVACELMGRAERHLAEQRWARGI
jgi:trans-AT polyketide synthase/acyltransferase/oxidoreductase domain-containing protein